MENERNLIKTVCGAIGGAMAYVFGSFDSLIVVLVCMVTMDYLSGVTKAFVLGTVSSRTGFKGLLKKLMVFLLVGVGSIIDRFIPSANGAVRSAVIMFYVANEGISILENAAEIGLPMPELLKNALAQLKDGKKGK